MTKVRYGYRMCTLLGGGLLLGSLMMAQWSAAATYYVAPDGADDNPGTADQPFRTVYAGVQVLAPGDTLYLRAGTYQESLIDTIPSGESWDNPVTVKAYSGESVTLRPLSFGMPLAFGTPDSRYVIVDGLSLDAANNDAAVVWIGGGTHHIRLVNCELKNSLTSGLMVSGQDHEFINLNVHDNGSTDFDHGLYIWSSNNLVEGSKIYHNAGWGVHIHTGTGSGADNNIVRGNEIYENAWAGARGPGIILSSGTGNIAEGNRIWGNQGGIQIDYGSENAQAYANEIYDNNGYGISIGAGSQGAVVHDNNVYDNPGGDILDNGSGSIISR
jgi:nitrous oxidase accessory protein NosD